MYILLHFESNWFMRNCALYLINYIKTLNGGELFKASIKPSPQIHSLNEEIIIDFRCGKEPDKLAGLRPDVYYSDVEEVANFLRLYADKQNGVRIHEIVHVKHILLDYILHKKLAPALDNAILYGTEGEDHD